MFFLYFLISYVKISSHWFTSIEIENLIFICFIVDGNVLIIDRFSTYKIIVII